MIKGFICAIALFVTFAACQAQTHLMMTTVVPASGLNNQIPQGELVLGNDGLLYGTTPQGGVFGKGTIFKTTIDGAITNFVSFDGTNGANPVVTPLQTTDGSFYGVTPTGGSMGGGTVYRTDSNGTFSVIYSFDLTNGSAPADLIMGKDGNLYGVTSYGGVGYGGTTNSGNGVVFKITTNGNYTRLADFSESNSVPGSLVEANDGNFYGVTMMGGSYGAGTIFRMDSSNQLETLTTFTVTNGWYPMSVVPGSDGCLYGLANQGGELDADSEEDGWGTIFKVTTNGDFTILREFSYTDGAWPYGRLLEVSNGVFYGATYWGGHTGGGTVFKITTNGDFEDFIQFDLSRGRDTTPMVGVTMGPDGNIYGVLTELHGIVYCLRPVEGPMVQSTVQNGQIYLTWHAWGGLAYGLACKTNLSQTDWQFAESSFSWAPQTNTILSCQVPIGPDPQDFPVPSLQRFYSIGIGIPEHWW